MALRPRILQVVVEVALKGGHPEDALMIGKKLGELEFGLDEEFQPIPMPTQEGNFKVRSALVRGAMASLRVGELSKHPSVINVWLDSPIDLFGGAGPQAEVPKPSCPISPCDCDFVAKGKVKDVLKLLRVRKVWEAGIEGRGATIGVVDSGIEAAEKIPGGISNVIGGFPGDWGTKSIELHGNMVAFNTLKVAPKASLYDLRVIDVGGVDLLSNAAQAFQWAIARFAQDGTPQVLTCSWGINQSADDPSYARDPDHFLTIKIREAVSKGMAVLFAAGNCGPACPLYECGSDFGPDRSIWGANGASEVITVGAVNVDKRLVGYSSCGRASLDDTKPDICGVSEFIGYNPSGDFGTSAACPLVAGIVALLRERKPGMSPQDVKRAMLRTADQIGGLSGWNAFSGYGVVDAWGAFQEIVAWP